MGIKNPSRKSVVLAHKEHLNHRYAQADVVWNIGTGYFGARNLATGEFCPETFQQTLDESPGIKMLEVKLSQGAKPGHGGILPKEKLTEDEILVVHEMRYPLGFADWLLSSRSCCVVAKEETQSSSCVGASWLCRHSAQTHTSYNASVVAFGSLVAFTFSRNHQFVSIR